MESDVRFASTQEIVRGISRIRDDPIVCDAVHSLHQLAHFSASQESVADNHCQFIVHF